jgi:hypothetical protein
MKPADMSFSEWCKAMGFELTPAQEQIYRQRFMKDRERQREHPIVAETRWTIKRTIETLRRKVNAS